MNAEVFFDTNVLFYTLSGDATRADRAETLLRAGGIVSVQVLNEFAAVARRRLAMPWNELRDVLATIRAFVAVEPLTVETHDRALVLASSHGYSIYDSLILSSALSAGCNRLYSEDMQHGQVIEGKLAIVNPFASTGKAPPLPG